MNAHGRDGQQVPMHGHSGHPSALLAAGHTVRRQLAMTDLLSGAPSLPLFLSHSLPLSLPHTPLPPPHTGPTASTPRCAGPAASTARSTSRCRPSRRAPTSCAPSRARGSRGRVRQCSLRWRPRARAARVRARVCTRVWSVHGAVLCMHACMCACARAGCARGCARVRLRARVRAVQCDRHTGADPLPPAPPAQARTCRRCARQRSCTLPSATSPCWRPSQAPAP